MSSVFVFIAMPVSANGLNISLEFYQGNQRI